MTVLSAPATAQLRQESQQVVAVEIEGNTSIPDTAILRHVRAHPDREVTPQQIREDKRALYGTRWFFSVEHEYRRTNRGTVLVFHVHERPVVQRVTYLGNKKIKTKHLESWTGLQPGSPMDPTSNREAVRQIERRYREKGYNHAKVTLEKGGHPDDRQVVFRIEEGPKVRVLRRRVHGSDFVSGARLKTKLQTKAAFFGLLGGQYDPNTIPNDVESLKKYYHALGFFDVEVEAKPAFSENKAWVNVDYVVREGQRFRVRRIELVGNHVVSNEEFKQKFELQEGDYFNARFMNKDVGMMLEKYDGMGRYFAQVEPVPRFLEESGVVDIVYQVDEDRIRYLRLMNVHFLNGHSNTKETVVLDRSPISPGDPVSRRLLRRLRGRLASSGIFEPGPTGVRVDVKPVDNPLMAQQPDGVTRGQNTESGESQRFDKNVQWLRGGGIGHSVRVPGHSAPVTSPHSVARPQSSTPTRETDGPGPSAFVSPTSPDLVFRGQEPPTVRAQNFDPNNPIYDNSPLGDPFGRPRTTPPPGYVDIDVFANEGRTGRLMFGAGVNSDAGIVGSFVYDEANFDLFRPPTSWVDFLDGRAWRGGGQRLRVEAVPGDVVSRYSLSWTDPFFLYSDYSLSVSGFYFNRFYPDWDERRGGGRVAIGKQINNETSITGSIRLEEVKLSDPRGNPVPPPSLAAAVGSNFLSTFRVAVTHDTRDASVLPSEGHFAEASYEQAFGEFNYPRFEGEYRQFFTVYSRPDGSGRHVFSVSGNFGWSGDDTPIFERFYAGGFQSFRGFAFRGVSPSVNNVFVGGDWMLLGSAEYRLPLTANDMIQAVAFTDFGSVEPDVGLDNFRLTVGAGLRVTIPQMGAVPLAFDFGFPIMKEDTDDERVFSFYVSVNR